MGFPFAKVFNIGTVVVTAIARAVPVLQGASRSGQPMSGAEKKATVLELVAAELAAAELLIGRNLAEDADVIDAAGTVNDAVVALHKLLARKAATAGA
jgi:hypothetical protein